MKYVYDMMVHCKSCSVKKGFKFTILTVYTTQSPILTNLGDRTLENTVKKGEKCR